MPKSITEPLLRDHAKIRTLAGELKAFTERFDLPGMRQTAQAIQDVLDPHTLKEEAALYLIGMKFLKADNKVLPDLIKEHHHVAGRFARFQQLLFSARLTNVEDQARQLVFLILEALDHHLREEEVKVFPALESLIDDQTKELILARYGAFEAGNPDELDRMPLLSLPSSDEDPSKLSFY